MKISIVIPTFNEEKYIGKCLDSIFNQSEKPDEIILVNNNSTDRTIDIAKKYKKLIIINELNQGIAFARDAGFGFARGDILVKVDADTILTKDFIKKIKRGFINNLVIAYTVDFIMQDVFILNRSVIFSRLYQLFFRIIYGHNILIGPAFAVLKNVWLSQRENLCKNDDAAHEDIDLSLHVSGLGKIYYDKNNLVFISGRRLKFNPISFFIEYPLIFLKMLWSHRKQLRK